MPATPLLQLVDVSKSFFIRDRSVSSPSWSFTPHRQELRAVSNVNLTLHSGQTLGIVGESGCGKSTLGRMIMHLLVPSSGNIFYRGQDITRISEQEMRPLRKNIQAVFQDPYSSLNPRMTVFEIIAEPLRTFQYSSGDIARRVRDLLDFVGLPIDSLSRYPHAFSGGQRQRISIARALATNAELIVCDEAVSALDVSVQAQVLNLFRDIQTEFGGSLVFISHNLAVVRHISQAIAVMYLGQVVETALEHELFETPLHPYTRGLLASIPEPDPNARSAEVALRGDIPSPLNPPPGCPFQTRCPQAVALCRERIPPTVAVTATHGVACHQYTAHSGFSLQGKCSQGKVAESVEQK